MIEESGGNIDDSLSIPHVICSAIEHPAVICHLRLLQIWKSITFSVAPVNHEGVVDVEAIKQLLRPSTALVTIMHSNNEIGMLTICNIILNYDYYSEEAF